MKGLVTKSTGSWYYVKMCDSNEMIPCRVRGKFRLQNYNTTNPVAVGDIVEVYLEENKNETTGIITNIYDRKNAILRRATKAGATYQIIATNLDGALLMITPHHPYTPMGFIDRFLVLAEAYNVDVYLIFHKSDLYDKNDTYFNTLYNIYKQIGYKIFLTSVITSNGIDELKNFIKDKTFLLAGQSGVGKSSLINKLDSLQLKTQELSEKYKKGRHTTTFAEMHFISTGGAIIDTPGIKEFGLPNFEKWELGHWYREFKPYIYNCKYNNCTHVNEPECAVISAVENGEINPLRYKNYLNILLEDTN
jgi:ribosome biogenesis GTPase